MAGQPQGIAYVIVAARYLSVGVGPVPTRFFFYPRDLSLHSSSI